ncbi:MAG: hypothetical protein KJ739_00995 [Nitrospinae bacterium]|nr:hypothetical protein [Nitrospinota bacterium]
MNYAKAHRLFGVLLYPWCTHTDATRAMSSIPFDKLITLSSRLWNALAKNSGESTTGGELSTPVSFLVPHRLFPGKHGPGHGMLTHDEGKLKYIGEILYLHQKLGIQQDIVVKPPEENKDEITHEKTVFTTGLTPTTKSGILERSNIFNDSERIIIDELAEILRHLNEEEIRALGTHENADQTAGAIIFELDHWKKFINYAIDLIAGSRIIDDKGRNAFWYSIEAFEYADEAVRKSKTNMKAYNEAWNRFDKHIVEREGLILKAFIKKQKKAPSIWDATKVHDLSIDAQKAMSFSKILRAFSLCKQIFEPSRPIVFSKHQDSIITEGLEGISEIRDLMKNPLQPKLFKNMNTQSIEVYLTQRKNFEETFQNLKDIKLELLDSMSWENIKKQL